MFPNKDKAGVLFQGREAGVAAEPRPATSDRPGAAMPASDAPAPASGPSAKAGSSRIAFGGLFLFTMMLYIRPNDLVPGAFETFQIVKLVAIFTIIVYIGSQMARGKTLTIWPLEIKMLVVHLLLAISFKPLH